MRLWAIPIVALVGVASGAPQVQEWTLIEVARIGSEDHPTQALTRVGDVAIGKNGDIYIAQPNERTIRVFDQAGRYVRSIGREGEGPGEFRQLYAIGVLGDTLYASDHTLRRVTKFGPDGQVLRTLSFATPLIGTQPPHILAPTVPVMLLRDGSALVWPSLPIRSRVAGQTTVPLLRLSPDGRSVDTLAIAGAGESNVVVEVRGRRIGVPPPFPDGPLHAFLADGAGVVVVERSGARETESAVFHVATIDLAGDTLFKRAPPYDRAPLTRRILDRAIADIQGGLASDRQLGADQLREALETGGHVPRTLPPVTQIASGTDGTIWLKRERTEASETLWQILDRTGRHVADAHLPARQSVRVVTHDVVIALELNEFGVPYVVRYRIDRGPRR